MEIFFPQGQFFFHISLCLSIIVVYEEYFKTQAVAWSLSASVVVKSLASQPPLEDHILAGWKKDSIQSQH